MKPLFPRNLTVPSTWQIILGACYLPVYLVGLSYVLPLIFRHFGIDSSTDHGFYLLQLTYFTINAVFTLLVFHRFLFDSLAVLKERRLSWLFLTVAIAYGISAVGTNIIAAVYTLLQITPENVNQDIIETLLVQHPLPMLLFIALLGPVSEELLFRGVLFGPICRRCPWLAYSVTTLLFAGIHVIASIGTLQPFELLLCFLQYVPISLALCWAYQNTRSIWGSICLHCMLNGVSAVTILCMHYLEEFAEAFV